MKSKQRQKAKELRSQGLSIKNISQQLGVSSSSVSLWVRNIKLTSEQIKNLEQQNPIFNNQLNGSRTIAKRARLKRLQYQEGGAIKAREGNLLHQAGCMLYWAEGTKSKNSCKFTNSDVNMMKLFLHFLRETFNLSNDKIIIRLNYYTNNGLTKEDIEKFWLDNLELEHSSLRKGQENNRPRSITNAVRHNKLIYGICCIEVYSQSIVQHIYGAIQEYAKFNNNYMLM